MNQIQSIISSGKSLNKILLQLLSTLENQSDESQKKIYSELAKYDFLKFHFSTQRQCYIDLLNMNHDSSILEIGASSGLLTNYMGKSYKKVVAIEENPALAEIALTRCDKQKNIFIYNKNIESFSPTEKFDYIVFTADLEQLKIEKKSFIYISNIMKNIPRLCSEKTILILSFPNYPSIYTLSGRSNNQLFLEFFSRMELGEKDLETYLKGYRFNYFQTYYAYPCNIYPLAVFSKEVDNIKIRNFGYWAYTASKISDKKIPNLIMAGEIARKGLIGQLANAFILKASIGNNKVTSNKLVEAYTINGVRHDDFHCVTIAYQTKNEIFVKKRGKEFTGKYFSFIPNETNPLFRGISLDQAFLSIVNSGDIDHLNKICDNYISSLINHFYFQKKDDNKTVLLSGKAFDAIPRNTIKSNGQFYYFDLEWRTNFPIPIQLILFRTFHYISELISPKDIIHKLRLRNYHIKNINDLIRVMINVTNQSFSVTKQDVTDYNHLEKRFIDFATKGNDNLLKETDFEKELIYYS